MHYHKLNWLGKNITPSLWGGCQSNCKICVIISSGYHMIQVWIIVVNYSHDCKNTNTRTHKVQNRNKNSWDGCNGLLGFMFFIDSTQTASLISMARNTVESFTSQQTSLYSMFFKQSAHQLSNTYTGSECNFKNRTDMFKKVYYCSSLPCALLSAVGASIYRRTRTSGYESLISNQQWV